MPRRVGREDCKSAQRRCLPPLHSHGRRARGCARVLPVVYNVTRVPASGLFPLPPPPLLRLRSLAIGGRHTTAVGTHCTITQGAHLYIRLNTPQTSHTRKLPTTRTQTRTMQPHAGVSQSALLWLFSHYICPASTETGRGGACKFKTASAALGWQRVRCACCMRGALRRGPVGGVRGERGAHACNATRAARRRWPTTMPPQRPARQSARA